MRKTINIDLNKKNSVRDAIKQLRAYKSELHRKCRTFVSRLATVGIETAKLNCGEYGNVITFSRDIDSRYAGGAKGRIVAVGTPVARLRSGETIYMNPLLMAEFGSGFEARVLDKVEGVGQGTFPGQTHAFDPMGWWYTDEDGETHHSYGETPTYPMHSADIAMILDINRIAKEVFGGG